MATAAAAIVAKARRDIQHEFFSSDAVRPDRTIAFNPGSGAQRRVFDRWERLGIIHKNGSGSYWLDVVAYDIDLRARHNRLRAVLLVMVGIVLVGLLTGLLSFHQP